MGYSYVGGANANGGAVATLSVVIPTGAPATGSLVCFAATFGAGSTVTSFAVKDSNNNAYTISPHSPSTNVSGAGYVYLAYLLSAPSNASATVTATWTTNASGVSIFADNFGISGGTAGFDTDLGGTGGSGTAINTPSLILAGSSELLYASVSPVNTPTAPTAGGTQGLWTGTQGGIAGGGNGGVCEYILSGSGTIAVNATQSPGASWSSMAMAFTFTASGGGTPSGNFSFDDYGQVISLGGWRWR